MLDELKEEEIVNKVGGRFKLSTLIQKRMVALNTGAKPQVDLRGADKLTIVIQEILQDKIYLDASGIVQTRNQTVMANLLALTPACPARFRLPPAQRRAPTPRTNDAPGSCRPVVRIGTRPKRRRFHLIHRGPANRGLLLSVVTSVSGKPRFRISPLRVPPVMAQSTSAPALASTADSIPYVPVSWMAVAAFTVASLFVAVLLALGVSAFLAKKPLIQDELLALPAVGIVLSFAARRVIRNSEGTRTGERLANSAWWICVIAGLGYAAYLAAIAYSIRRDAKSELEKWAASMLDPDEIGLTAPFCGRAIRQNGRRSIRRILPRSKADFATSISGSSRATSSELPAGTRATAAPLSLRAASGSGRIAREESTASTPAC